MTDDDPPAEMPDVTNLKAWSMARKARSEFDETLAILTAPPDRTLVDVLDDAVYVADRDNLDALITVTLTASDGSVVTVTKESAARLRRKV